MTSEIPSIHPATARLLTSLCRQLAVDGAVGLRELDAIVGKLRTPLPVPEVRDAKSQATGPRRSEPLKRLLVQPFEHLLAGPRPVVPREVLPNYFSAVADVVGDDWEAQARRCRTVMRALYLAHGGALSWAIYYADPRSAAVLSDVLGPVARNLMRPRERAAFLAKLRQPVEQLSITPAAFERLASLLVDAARDAHRRAGREAAPTATSDREGDRHG